MKKYLFLLLLFVVTAKTTIAQTYLGVQRPHIYQVFCNPKNAWITVRANGLNGVYIGCTVEVIVGARTEVIDLPVQYIRGDKKFVFYVPLKRYKFPKAFDYQQIIYSYTLALWTTIIPSANFNINNPSTYKMTGLVQGSMIHNLARNWKLH